MGIDTGKTTLLNALAAAIPEEEHIVVIEDTSEILIDEPRITVPRMLVTGEPGREDLEDCRQRDRPNSVQRVRRADSADESGSQAFQEPRS